MRSKTSFAFPLLGQRCTVVNASRSQTRWIRRHWQFTTPAISDHPLNIRLKFTRQRPEVLEKSDIVPGDLHVHEATLRCRHHGESWWSIGDHDCGVEWRRRSRGILIRVWCNDQTASQFPLEAALQVALCEALRGRGLVPLHAAVATRDQDAIAFVGASGTGKSSALLIAVQQGWHPVAEDFAWLEPGTGVVYGWDRGVHLAHNAIAQLSPRSALDYWRPDGTGKWLLEYSHIQPPRQPCARLTRVALLHRDGQVQSAWQPLTRHECVRALYEAAGVPLERESRAAFAACVPGLLSRLRMERLVSGCTPFPLSAEG